MYSNLLQWAELTYNPSLRRRICFSGPLIPFLSCKAWFIWQVQLIFMTMIFKHQNKDIKAHIIIGIHILLQWSSRWISLEVNMDIGCKSVMGTSNPQIHWNKESNLNLHLANATLLKLVKLQLLHWGLYLPKQVNISTWGVAAREKNPRMQMLSPGGFPHHVSASAERGNSPCPALLPGMHVWGWGQGWNLGTLLAAAQGRGCKYRGQTSGSFVLLGIVPSPPPHPMTADMHQGISLKRDFPSMCTTAAPWLPSLTQMRLWRSLGCIRASREIKAGSQDLFLPRNSQGMQDQVLQACRAPAFCGWREQAASGCLCFSTITKQTRAAIQYVLLQPPIWTFIAQQRVGMCVCFHFVP